MAIEALEQQISGRFVTKEVVRKQMLKYGFHAPDMTVTEFVEDLPSVIPPITPQKKMGRWIAVENEEMKTVGYYCLECDLPMETEYRTKFCPICGAKMEEVEE